LVLVILLNTLFMKYSLKIFTFCIAVCSCNSLFAQFYIAPQAPNYPVVSQPGATLTQVIDTMHAHADPTDTAEGGAIDQINTFTKLWRGRATANNGTGANMFRQYYTAARRAATARIASPCSGPDFSGNWQPVGPDSLQVQAAGYTNAVWANPADSNYILAGSIFGGLFKTTNGGKNWACITDNAPLVGGIMGVNCIAVNPLNANTIYIGTTGEGILKSFDGGNTWQQELIVGDSAATVAHIFFTPDSIRLYAFKNDTAANSDSVYTRLNVGTGNPWINITPAAFTGGGWNDLQFVPGNRSHFYIASTGMTNIWEATDSLALWPTNYYNQITSGFTDVIGGVTYTAWSIMDMSIPTSDTLYFAAMTNDRFVTSLYKYNITGVHHIAKVSDDLPYYGNPGPGKFQLIVSPNNPNNMYFASDVPSMSYDRGRTFNYIGEYYGAPTHGDVRAIYLQHSGSTTHGTQDRLYLATDGGIGIKPTGVDPSVSGSSTTKDISGNGLACGTYWSFAISESGGEGIGCMMHDGIVSYEPNRSPKWKSLGTSDAWGCVIDGANQTKAYGWLWSTDLDATVHAGGREMGSLDASFPEPNDAIDPGFPGVAKTTATAANGDIYCVGKDFWRKRPTDASFWQPGWGFLSGIPSTYVGARIALNPDDTTFNGYVLYNQINNIYGAVIYYRHFPTYGVSAFPVLTAVPSQSSYTVWASAVLNGITTDPRNTERVWVCEAGPNDSTYFSGSTLFRVHFSPDHGTNWYDISNGLGSLPVGNLTYDETTNMLYCSTDAGIYQYNFNHYDPAITSTYWGKLGGSETVNTSVAWTCFNTGATTGHDFPNVAVEELQINHCEGKLYAATYGRSIWETDLNPPGAFIYPQPTDTITGSPIWGGNQYIHGGIIIPNGVTLTLTNDTVHMPKNGKIIVEPGGHLIVNHSEITNDCGQCMWQGIEAVGQVSLPQTPTSNQGWVTVQSGSTIQHAINAVTNTDPIVGYATNGGIIQCSNSYFINNDTSASFFGYDNWDWSIPRLNPNLSYFSNCVFENDNNYKGKSPMNFMVLLENVEGINFFGCQYLNRNMLGVNKGNGEGIHAYNAGFSVVPYYCCGRAYGYRSRFCGLSNGVDIQGLNPWGLTAGINQADFDTITIGVDANAYNNVSVTNCTFKVGLGNGTDDSLHTLSLPGCYENIGILTQNASQFRIQNNSFKGVPNGVADWYNFGTVVANSGMVTNKITNCSFDSLLEGVYAIGCNVNGPTTDGLKISCNTFSHNTYDIQVSGDGGKAPQGISPMQVAFNTDAGNTFTSSTHNIIDNVSSAITYYYGTGSSDYPYDVTVTSVGRIPASIGSACPSGGGYPPESVAVSTGLDMSALRSQKSSFYSNKATLTGLLASYNALIDYGNTDSLVHYIDSATSSTALYSTLSYKSPYISKTALEEVANVMALSYAAMKSILLLNPDDLKDNNFVTYVNNDYHFSVADMAALVSASAGTTARTTLEGSMGSTRAAMADEADLIMMALKTPTDTNVSVTDTATGICTDSTSVYYLLDSNRHYYGLDSVDKWLQNTGGLWTSYDRAGYYNWIGDTSIADSIFTGISALIPPTDTADREVYNDYSLLWTAIQHAEAHGRNVYSLNSDEIATFDTSTTVTDYNTPRRTMRQIIHVVPWILPPTLCIGFATYSGPTGRHGGLADTAGVPIPPIIDINGNNKNNRFSAFPNPTSGVVTFSYNVQDGSSGIRIVITNVVGEQMANIQQANTIGNAYWDSKSVTPGIYIYTASDANGVISKGKLVVIK
jgi:hypothetical protein